MMKKSILSLAVTGILSLVLLTMTGCIKQKVLVKVNKDGSGKIIVTRIFGKAMTDMYEKQMAKMKEQMSGNPNMNMANVDIFFNEQMLKMEGKQYGDVTYEKGKKIDKKYGKGSMAVYSFDDISKVTLGLNNSMSMPGQKAAKKERISFSLDKGSVDKLNIIIPQPDKSKMAAKASSANTPKMPEMDKKQREMMMKQMMAMGNPFDLTGNETQEEMMAKMFKGFSVKYEVQVEGEIVKTDASYKSKKKKNRITLLSVNLDKLLKDKDFISSLSGNPQAMQKTFLDLAGKPGIKMEEKKEIYVEFK